MAVQYGIGDLVVDNDDFQFKHNDKQLAIKIRQYALENTGILGCVQKNGVWYSHAQLFEFDSFITPERVIAEYGDAGSFVEKKLVPAINHWLVKEFEVMGDDSYIAAINAALKSLVVEVFNNIPQVKKVYVGV